jgi:hypothetical protein
MSKEFNRDNEFWLDNPRYNDHVFKNHQVSSQGRIRNKKRLNVLKPIIDKDGYERLSIGSVDNVLVHKVVCETFAGSAPHKGMEVNHIDADRTNNHCLNLEWVTSSENTKWGVHKGNINPIKASIAAIEVNKTPVRIVELDMIFESVKDCAEYLGVHPNRIPRVLKGERKGQLLHGYHLEYV